MHLSLAALNSPRLIHATPETTRAFFGCVIAEALAKTYARERKLYGMDEDIPYVAGLLAHSALLGKENPLSIWGGGVFSGSEITDLERKIAENAFDHQTAQTTADQLLLRMGCLHRQQRLWTFEAVRLKNCGGSLYREASIGRESPARERLQSMGANFLPWADVLRQVIH
jgi:hypothetical protein